MQFYESLFGFRCMQSSERFCALDVAGTGVLLLFQRDGTLEPVVLLGGVVPPHDGGGHLHLAFAISKEDLIPWKKRLKEANIAIESEVHWDRGGDSLYFRDLDGHLLELATPGVWPAY